MQFCFLLDVLSERSVNLSIRTRPNQTVSGRWKIISSDKCTGQNKNSFLFQGTCNTDWQEGHAQGRERKGKGEERTMVVIWLLRHIHILMPQEESKLFKHLSK